MKSKSSFSSNVSRGLATGVVLFVVLAILSNSDTVLADQLELGAAATSNQRAIELKQELVWKTPEDVIAVLGQPNKRSDPRGTHARYTLWEYDELVVAFADERVIHVFDKNSLHRNAAP